jgi:prevent-host-death family protein
VIVIDHLNGVPAAGDYLRAHAEEASISVITRAEVLADTAYVWFAHVRDMKAISATEARKRLYKLLDEVAVTSEPVQITGRRASAVLVSEADWRALEETVYLSSIPGLADSIRKGMATPVEECVR